MIKSPYVLIISDLHLDPAYPRITRDFLTLLRNYDKSSVNALYILGDLFEHWIGDDDDSPFVREIIAALRSATQAGLAIFIQHGNRDFLIGRRFLHATGCQWLADETRISLYGEPVLLMHGDTLCTADTAYMRARRLSRNRLIQACFLRLPLRLRKKIAARLRQKSQRHTAKTSLAIMDVTPTAVTQVMAKHNVTYLIHGHTHRPYMHHLAQQHAQQRIVLGAWHEASHVLQWHADGQRRFCTVEDVITRLYAPEAGRRRTTLES